MANAYTATADLATLPQYYHKVFLERFVVNPVMMDYAMKKPLPTGNGKVVYFPRLSNSSTTVSAYKLTEGTVISTEKVQDAQLSATIEQFGNAKAVWDLTELTAINGTVEEAVREMAEQAGNVVDKRIIQTAIGGAPAGPSALSSFINKGFSATVGITAYTEFSAAVATLSAGITGDKIRFAKKVLEGRNVPKYEDGYYVLVCHTDTANKLQEDSSWQEAWKYTDAENIRKGEAGRYAGVTIVTDNNIQTSANGSAGATVYYSILLGRGALGVTELDGGVNTYFKKSGEQDTSNPINQFITMGWKVNFVPKILNVSAGLLVASCDS